MPSGKREVALVLAADMFEQPQTRARMDDIVVFSHDVQQRTTDPAKVDRLIGYSEIAFLECVTPKHELVHFTVNLAGQRHIASYPVLEQFEHFGVAVTETITVASNVLVERVVNGGHQVEAAINHPRRAIAVDRGDEFDHIITDKIHEIVERQVASAHVKRNCERDQIS